MAPMTLYFSNVSTPSRCVVLAVRNLSVDIETVPLNLMAGEHRRSEFSKINPRCCVPTLVDHDAHDFVLWESKAILIYLAEKCPRHSSLYPKCPKLRAIIHQRLFYHASEFYNRILDVANLALSNPNPVITSQHKDNLRKALDVLENFLDDQEYFAGNNLTIADFAYLSSICTLIHFGFDISPFPKVADWYKRMKSVNGFDECRDGAQEFGAIIQAKLKNCFDDI